MSEANDVNEREGPGGMSLPSDFSAMLDKVLSNPEILTTVASALSATSQTEKITQEVDAPTQTAKTEDAAQTSAGAVDVDVMMQKLPQMMKLLSPMLSATTSKNQGSSPHTQDKRTCLLCAIKPYLSPARCEAIDYIIKFSQLSEILKTIN